MGHRSLFACAAAVLVACSSSPARITSRPGGATQPAACWPSGSHTLSWNGAARIFRWHAAVYGCSSNAGRRYRLGAVPRSIRGGRVGPFALADEVVAYGLTMFGVDTGSAEIVVRRLSTGRRLVADSATLKPLGPESFQSVGSLVVKRDGAVGWIGEAHSIIRPGAEIEVVEHDRGGQRLLDSGPGVKPGSLRLHNSKLTWQDGSVTRSASLS